MPTSVLLAVLAAAGLLALAPALVRRYDATERLVAERAQSTARVLPPPASPYRPGTATGPPAALTRRHAQRGCDYRSVDRAGLRASGRPPLRSAARRATRTERSRRRPPSPPQHTPAVYRRRRVLAALLLLNVVELIGVLLVGPGFWIGFAVTFLLLAVYLVHLRGRALADVAAAAPEPGRPPGWPPGRPRCAANRPAAPRPVGRRSAAWPPSARGYAEPPWAWTALETSRRRSTGARSRTDGRAGYAAAPTRPAEALTLGVPTGGSAGRLVRRPACASCLRLGRRLDRLGFRKVGCRGVPDARFPGSRMDLRARWSAVPGADSRYGPATC